MSRILICSALAPFHNGRLLKTATVLAEAGHAVEVAALAGTETQLQIDAGRFVPLHALQRNRSPLPSNPLKARAAGFLRFRAFRKQLTEVFDRIRPDAVHMLDYEVLAAMAGRLEHARAVYDAVEFFADTAEGTGAADYVKRLYARTGNKIDQVLTVSERLADALRTSHPELPPALVVPNAVRPLSAEEIGKAREKRKALLPLAIYQGGFSKGRGLTDIIDAAHILRGQWRFALRGWGPAEAEIRARIDALFPEGDPERPELLPPLPYWELPYWTATADIGLIPYMPGPINHMIATPNKLYEYPAAGLPVLASDLPSVRSSLNESGAGWVVSGSSAEQLAGRLGSLTEGQLLDTRRAAMAFAKRQDWARHAKQLVSVYA